MLPEILKQNCDDQKYHRRTFLMDEILDWKNQKLPSTFLILLGCIMKYTFQLSSCQLNINNHYLFFPFVNWSHFPCFRFSQIHLL
jgi:hypothetical protein